MDMGTRLVAAYRRVGLVGLLSYVRWRLNKVLKGRGVAEGLADLTALVRRQGVSGLIQRARWGLRELRSDDLGYVDPDQATVEPHEWLTTFAHAAAFNPHFDLTEQELATNREVVARFDSRPAHIRTATWFLTYFNHALFGGIHTILRLMDHMTEHHGVEHRLVVFDRVEAEDAEIRDAITAVFPRLSDVDIVLPHGGAVHYDELPATDIAVCTMWISAYPLARFNQTSAKFYMIQDFERDFYPAGTLSALADATYRFGFAGLVNTPGLAAVYEDYGNPAVAFVPAVEVPKGAHDPKPSTRLAAPIQIVLYGRPSTDRNAFELIASSCVGLKERYGDRIRIVSAGEEWEPEDFELDGVVENLGLLQTMEDVQRLYVSSDIGICFMLSKHPSYQPLEYLAARCAPVVNVNPATTWLLEHERNCLVTEPMPSAIQAAVARLIEDPTLRERLVDIGHADVTATSWGDEFATVWDFMTGRPGS